ncbi:4-diphosphocytidyl-2-C-methyl-D-erythritol kinase [Spirochaetia bacterium]|nr:4-diphosphocytidyl-2-C-methyl-D-erythritol kinase [Spirochaetia bacterium]GHU30384.1 4-diphosphocytidyl-2-C-methyl-D-erythritol kinase [Spirochaetia bacterium]
MLTIDSPAKVNLHLGVYEKNPDGFHRIESIMLALRFGDILHVECAVEDALQFSGLAVPEENSIQRAIQLFRNYTGWTEKIRIQVEKRIPIGAGLGGGSSNAITTLKALDHLAGSIVSPELFRAMAEEIGSDGAFFLSGGAAWVEGRGEICSPIPYPDGLSIVLVYPGFQSSTASAYRWLDSYRDQNGLPFTTNDRSQLIAALATPPCQWHYFNDFLPVLMAYGHFAYKFLLEDLENADFSGLSGSGSSCFGIYQDPDQAKRSAAILSEKWPFVVCEQL